MNSTYSTRTDSVKHTESEQHVRRMYRATKAVWYVLMAIEVILGLRLLMRVLGANEAAAFTQIVYGISAPFVAPFRLVFDALSVGQLVFEPSTVLAMAVYWLIAWGIVRLILLPRPVRDQEAERALERQDVE